jgi:hypothetical protein
MANHQAKKHPNLTMRQRVREMLLEGRTAQEIATALQIATTTVYRVRGKPEFAARLATVREARLKIAEDRFTSLVDAATNTLRTAIDEMSDCPWPSRIKAATEILDRAGAISRAGPSTVVVTAPKLTPEDEAAAMRFMEEQLKAKGWMPPPEGGSNDGG